jgi:signal transduction histidine kinase
LRGRASRLHSRTTSRRAAAGTEQSDRTAAHGLLQAAERDLQQVVLDIHDGPVQDIFSALSQVHLLRIRPELQAGEASIGLRRVAAALERALGEIRSFIGAFRPPEFERRPVGAIIEGLIVQHESITGNSVDLELVDDLPEVSVSLKIAIYRILQEALANATRHAQATQQSVRMAVEGDELVIEVRDDGHGFDVAGVLESESDVGVTGGHFGLRGMRDRVAIMNGSLEIDSGEDGTSVEVRFPIQ